MTTLKQIISPIEMGSFLNEHWEKKHLFIKNMDRKFSDLFTYTDLAFLLNTHAHNLTYPEVRLLLDTKRIDPAEYIETITSFVDKNIYKHKLSPEKVNFYLKRSASLALNDIQDYNLKLSTLAHTLSAEISEQVNINLYHSAPGKNTFKNHCDPDSSFIIQLEGKKTWNIFEAPSDGTKDVQSLNPIDQFTMEKGDVLYLPKGVWHNAFGIEGNSLSINITMNRLSQYDLLLAVFESILLPVLDDDLELKHSLPLITGDVASIEKFDSIAMTLKHKILELAEKLTIDDLRVLFFELKAQRMNERGTSTHKFPFLFDDILVEQN